MHDFPLSHIRNFCIIAHIDHGKSTLADRLLGMSAAVDKRKLVEQTMDSMDLERERGITIKAKAIALPMVVNGEHYLFNLIDTPGHVDFGYEVSRAMNACEGALLLVDATQGIQAQTVANMYQAVGADLEVVPVANKVDMVAADFDRTCNELDSAFGIDGTSVVQVSAKTGVGVDDLVQEIVSRIPPPVGDVDAPLKALIFDAVYDDYRGVVVYVRVREGVLKKGDRIAMMATGAEHEILEVGVVRMGLQKQDRLKCGEVGYVICGMKTVQDVGVGDTVTLAKFKDSIEPLPGYKKPQPMVYAGVFPTSAGDYDALRKGLQKIELTDSAITYAPEQSGALGSGFRVGFLGMLHMEIFQERMERELDLDLVQTAPNVTYELLLNDNTTRFIDSAGDLPDVTTFKEIREPIVRVSVITPTEFIGNVMSLALERRGQYLNQEHLGRDRAMLSFKMPLAEVIFDFFDKLKSGTRGYATLDYEPIGFEESDLVKVRALISGEEVDALAMIVHRQFAEGRARNLLKRLKEEIPRHLFVVNLQAAIGGKVIASEKISAMRKNVLAKCYGGDISRKRKLLEKQKKGKKRMKMIGGVEVPQGAFLSVLKVENN
ncbi:MAG: translation elongation factor 4 [Planctomycetes bacterium]|nr:translation elongation factor 4 [Planctomycetota bacterium]MCA8937128.1 translation elongation factor 4 [Planctomycetota bacterium]